MAFGKVGPVSAERVGQGEMGGITHRVLCKWQLVENASGSDVFSSYLLSNLVCCHQIQSYSNSIQGRVN